MAMTILSFDGRASRQSYIVGVLYLYGVLYVCGALISISALSLDISLPNESVPAILASLRVPEGVAWLIGLLGFAGLIVFAVGNVILSVRRLHDAGQSGLLVMLYVALPLALPDLPWWAFAPPLSPLVWHAIMVALPQGRGGRACQSV